QTTSSRTCAFADKTTRAAFSGLLSNNIHNATGTTFPLLRSCQHGIRCRRDSLPPSTTRFATTTAINQHADSNTKMYEAVAVATLKCAIIERVDRKIAKVAILVTPLSAIQRRAFEANTVDVSSDRVACDRTGRINTKPSPPSLLHVVVGFVGVVAFGGVLVGQTLLQTYSENSSKAPCTKNVESAVNPLNTRLYCHTQRYLLVEIVLSRSHGDRLRFLPSNDKQTTASDAIIHGRKADLECRV
ncbi:hypothetical protein LSAT2_026593, partial [Lamellibrachia satsuma]